MNIQTELLGMADEEYRNFHAGLIPNIDEETIIGVRIPVLRKYAGKIVGTKESDTFLASLPHRYYDENILHALLLEKCRDADFVYENLETFLPYIDNWALCDVLNPRILAKDKPRLIANVRKWIASDEVYTSRFAVDMLMKYFLDDDFSTEYPELVSRIRTDEYYSGMVVAWYFATALAKQWDAVIPYLEEHRLDDWTHRKTIQKAIESYRITYSRKEYLRGLKKK